MTSTPASRSASATTFAPRSWPSRPGFAISTRSLPAMAAPPSHRRRLLEPAEHVQEHAVHLADRAVRPRAREERGHEVPRPARRVPQLAQRAAHLRRVAPPLHLGEPRHLPLPDAGVRLVQREGRLLRLREAVHADDHLLARLDPLLLPERLLGDLALDLALLDGADHAAHAVDTLDERRDLRLHAVGERLHVPGAAERVR